MGENIYLIEISLKPEYSFNFVGNAKLYVPQCLWFGFLFDCLLFVCLSQSRHPGI